MSGGHGPPTPGEVRGILPRELRHVRTWSITRPDAAEALHACARLVEELAEGMPLVVHLAFTDENDVEAVLVVDNAPEEA